MAKGLIEVSCTWLTDDEAASTVLLRATARLLADDEIAVLEKEGSRSSAVAARLQLNFPSLPGTQHKKEGVE